MPILSERFWCIKCLTTYRGVSGLIGCVWCPFCGGDIAWLNSEGKWILSDGTEITTLEILANVMPLPIAT